MEKETRNIEENILVMKIKEKTKKMVSELQRRKSMSLVEGALMSGYSLSYFQSFILNVLKLLYKPCISYSRGEIRWICGETPENK
ncbi:MAG: hypothetical protein QW456_10315 [Ignisphaera sp.]